MDENRQRHQSRRLRSRRARRYKTSRFALRRNRTRHPRIVSPRRQLAIAPVGCARQRMRLTNPGLMKFPWDLRYPGATTFPGMILWSANAASGPTAVPGKYQVRLTVGDHVETQPLLVKIDPRLSGVTEKDLQEQFDLAMKIRDKTSEANQAVIDIREIKKQAKDRADKAKEPAITAAAEALTRKLSEVEEEIYQVRNQSNQDPLNFPIKLNNRIAALRRSVETGDARPTNASSQVFRELSSQLDNQLAKLKGLVSGDLAELNGLLAAKNLEPV